MSGGEASGGRPHLLANWRPGERRLPCYRRALRSPARAGLSPKSSRRNSVHCGVGRPDSLSTGHGNRPLGHQHSIGLPRAFRPRQERSSTSGHIVSESLVMGWSGRAPGPCRHRGCFGVIAHGQFYRAVSTPPPVAMITRLPYITAARVAASAACGGYDHTASLSIRS